MEETRHCFTHNTDRIGVTAVPEKRVTTLPTQTYFRRSFPSYERGETNGRKNVCIRRLASHESKQNVCAYFVIQSPLVLAAYITKKFIQ